MSGSDYVTAVTSPEQNSLDWRRWLVTVAPLFIILAVALGLRLWRLGEIPPGLTHDEANHGREAIGILNGVYRYFFPLNYGSEPLYSYTVAATMSLLGEKVLALRLVNVLAGVAAIAATAAWSWRRLGRPVTLLAASLIAVSFWPLASSREALRAGMLPLFLVVAVWLYWIILERRAPDYQLSEKLPDLSATPLSAVWPVVGLALAIVATLHIYLAARVSWLLFPLFLAYLGLFHQPVWRRAWRPVISSLLLAGLLTLPMIIFLRNNPDMQTRLGMLDQSLQRIVTGDWLPIFTNSRNALLAFVWPGYGDQFLAYNIPGRPVFNPVSAVFFLTGIAVCLWKSRQPIYAFLLFWLLVGIVPSLLTGPTANTTRNLAALPAVYLTAAVGFAVPAALLVTRWKSVSWLRPLLIGVGILWIVWAGWTSTRDYFAWGESAAVRGAYQHTLVEGLAYLETQDDLPGALVISSQLPGPAHDPSVALVAGNESARLDQSRWVDARYGLALPPDGPIVLLAPQSTPPHPFFDDFLYLADSVNLRPDDLDPGFTLFEVDTAAMRSFLRAVPPVEPPVDFNGAIELVGAQWLSPTLEPGQMAELLTVWRVLDPTRAGPVASPSYTTDAVLFTHVVDDQGNVIAQRDSLEVPSWAWQEGDLVLQIHPIAVGVDVVAGEYAAVVGFYDRASGTRLPLGNSEATTAPTPPLIVTNP